MTAKVLNVVAAGLTTAAVILLAWAHWDSLKSKPKPTPTTHYGSEQR